MVISAKSSRFIGFALCFLYSLLCLFYFPYYWAFENWGILEYEDFGILEFWNLVFWDWLNWLDLVELLKLEEDHKGCLALVRHNKENK